MQSKWNTSVTPDSTRDELPSSFSRTLKSMVEKALFGLPDGGTRIPKYPRKPDFVWHALIGDFANPLGKIKKVEYSASRAKGSAVTYSFLTQKQAEGLLCDTVRLKLIRIRKVVPNSIFMT
jgi:hypothetical protein